jgi:hypothetical protein
MYKILDHLKFFFDISIIARVTINMTHSIAISGNSKEFSTKANMPCDMDKA